MWHGGGRRICATWVEQGSVWRRAGGRRPRRPAGLAKAPDKLKSLDVTVRPPTPCVRSSKAEHRPGDAGRQRRTRCLQADWRRQGGSASSCLSSLMPSTSRLRSKVARAARVARGRSHGKSSSANAMRVSAASSTAIVATSPCESPQPHLVFHSERPLGHSRRHRCSTHVYKTAVVIMPNIALQGPGERHE